MTRIVKIADTYIGSGHPVIVQSMTNTDTADIDSTVEQILALESVGCEIVRMSVYDQSCAEAIRHIKDRTNIPLVADIHFDHRLAIASIEGGIDKVRINPGNIGSEDRVRELVDCAKAHSIPIRIGVNSGSLPKDLQDQFGSSPKAMVEAAFRHIRLLEKYSYENIVISLKASSVKKTIEACTEFARISDYPQHIGVTEAGSQVDGIVKASIGIGALLYNGIGDTIRVSISESPLREVEVAYSILNALGLRQRGLNVVSCPTCARRGLDVESIANRIKQHYASEIRHIDVAVMGCVVNGPGEAKDADIGIAGGREHSIIFAKGEKMEKVENSIAFARLCYYIDQILASTK